MRPARIGCAAVLRLINADDPPPRVTVGNAFQSKIAPLIFRFFHSVSEFGD
jgi:hypothetical protein